MGMCPNSKMRESIPSDSSRLGSDEGFQSHTLPFPIPPLSFPPSGPPPKDQLWAMQAVGASVVLKAGVGHTPAVHTRKRLEGHLNELSSTGANSYCKPFVFSH